MTTQMTRIRNVVGEQPEEVSAQRGMDASTASDNVNAGGKGKRKSIAEVSPQADRAPNTSRPIQINKHAPMKPAIR